MKKHRNLKLPVIYEFRRKAKSEIIVHWLVSLVFMIVALSYLYILIFAIISACKTHSEIVLNPFSIPTEWHWEHFIEVASIFSINGKGFWEMLFNSALFSIGPAFINQFILLWFAYVCTKYKFPGSGWVYTITMVVVTLPLYGTGGGMYKLYYNMGLIDSYAQLLTCLGANAFSMNLLYFMSYYQNLSGTYTEAAKMDGANDFQIFFKLMFPLAKPIFSAMALTQWLSLWNNYESSMIYHPNLPTLPYAIYAFNTEMIYRARLDILFGACVITCIPGIIMFIAFNKTLTTSVSLGGIKG